MIYPVFQPSCRYSAGVRLFRDSWGCLRLWGQSRASPGSSTGEGFSPLHETLRKEKSTQLRGFYGFVGLHENQ
ncbi:hypothetical protein Dda3937_04588 [Dickeya dadantii 3937]|uniref:Uncharacterized protein n=1 Tax=Dickeya dadantii (strain 3937) TaxID=198628 RepID=E0SCM4_DICD3|nr:hypothetical protein Dda3937_04588 [Dickeya dadantii 3937]